MVAISRTTPLSWRSLMLTATLADPDPGALLRRLGLRLGTATTWLAAIPGPACPVVLRYWPPCWTGHSGVRREAVIVVTAVARG